MPRSRVVRPETVRLELSDGDSIVIKKRLSAGERQAQLEGMYRMVDGELVFDRLAANRAMILAYLLDWSFINDDGTHIDIAGKGADEVLSALNAIDYESFKEIRDAINAHEDAMALARMAQKKIPNGETASSETSTSPAAAAGATSG